MNCQTYEIIVSDKLSFDNTALCGISKEIVYPLGCFPYKFNVDVFPMSTNFHMLKYIANDIVLGMDVIRKLNLVINEEGVKIVGERNNF